MCGPSKDLWQEHSGWRKGCLERRGCFTCQVGRAGVGPDSGGEGWPGGGREAPPGGKCALHCFLQGAFVYVLSLDNLAVWPRVTMWLIIRAKHQGAHKWSGDPSCVQPLPTPTRCLLLPSQSSISTLGPCQNLRKNFWNLAPDLWGDYAPRGSPRCCLIWGSSTSRWKLGSFPWLGVLWGGGGQNEEWVVSQDQPEGDLPMSDDSLGELHPMGKRQGNCLFLVK